MEKIKSFALILGVSIMSFFVSYLVFGWTEPTAAPPGGNVPAPINVGTTAQTKQATLTINPGELQAQLFRDVDAGCGLVGGSWYLNPSGTSVLCGNVGIGTTGPLEKLSVAGTLGLAGSGLSLGGTYNKFVQYVDTTNHVLFEAPRSTDAAGGTKLNYYFSHRGAGVSGALMTILGTGNVGIGTTNPGAKLEVAGEVKITGGSPGAGKVLTSDATGLASWQTPAGGLPSGSSGQTLRHDGTNWVANSVIYNNGTNVGIGTTGPVYKLDIAGDVRWTGTLQGGSVPWPRLTSFPSACSSGQYVTAVGDTLTCSAPPAGIGGSGTTNYLAKFTAGTTIGNSQIYDNGTNVGIGTTSPGEKLQVVGNIKLGGTEGDIKDVNAIIGYNDLFLKGNSAENAPVYIAGSQLNVYAGGSERMRITSDGNVGIGTASPGGKLSVVYASGQRGIESTGPSGNTHIPWTDGSVYISGANIIFRDSSNVERVRITGGGNVGIGTTNPGYKLDVGGEIRATGAIRTNTGTAVYLIGSAGCANSGALTIATTCVTLQCGSIFGIPYFYKCDGTCSSATFSPITCNNTFLGRLLSSY